MDNLTYLITYLLAKAGVKRKTIVAVLNHIEDLWNQTEKYRKQVTELQIEVERFRNENTRLRTQLKRSEDLQALREKLTGNPWEPTPATVKYELPMSPQEDREVDRIFRNLKDSDAGWGGPKWREVAEIACDGQTINAIKQVRELHRDKELPIPSLKVAKNAITRYQNYLLSASQAVTNPESDLDY